MNNLQGRNKEDAEKEKKLNEEYLSYKKNCIGNKNPE